MGQEALVLIAAACIYYPARYQYIYLDEGQSIAHLVLLLVVTVAASIIVFAFILFENASTVNQSILAAILAGPIIDLAQGTYPSTGCTCYITALLYFITSHEVLQHSNYAWVAGAILVISTVNFWVASRGVEVQRVKHWFFDHESS